MLWGHKPTGKCFHSFFKFSPTFSSLNSVHASSKIQISSSSQPLLLTCNLSPPHPSQFLNKLINSVSSQYFITTSPSILINNSSTLHTGNHEHDGVWIYDLNLHKFLLFYFSVFSLVLVSIEKIYQTLKKVFDHISKHREGSWKYDAWRSIFDELRGVWKCAQRLS